MTKNLLLILFCVFSTKCFSKKHAATKKPFVNTPPLNQQTNGQTYFFRTSRGCPPPAIIFDKQILALPLRNYALHRLVYRFRSHKRHRKQGMTVGKNEGSTWAGAFINVGRHTTLPFRARYNPGGLINRMNFY